MMNNQIILAAIFVTNVTLGIGTADLNGKNYQTGKNEKPDVGAVITGSLIRIHGVAIQKLSDTPTLGAPARFIIVQVVNGNNEELGRTQSDHTGNFELSLDQKTYKMSRQIRFEAGQKLVQQMVMPRLNSDSNEIDLKEIYLTYSKK